MSTTYTIQMASKISGVGVHTIRAWEKRYKALDPQRDASGHRTYTKPDIEKLMLLSELCLLGYTISKVAGLTSPELKAQLIDLGKSQESLEVNDFNLINDTKLTVDPAQSLPILNFALKSYKLDVISLELGKLKTLLSPKEFAMDILHPLSISMAESLASGEYSSHQEQALRSLMKFHMGLNLYHPIDRREKSTINVVVSGMEGDMTDLGLGSVGLLCNHYGFNYTYLGPDMTYEAVSDIVKSLDANMVIVGPTNVFSQLGKTHFQNYIEKLSMKLNPATELIVAGKSDLEINKIQSKRLVILKTLDAVDEYLSRRN
ncbi:MAG: MerR family transcriptional regulator [Bacteriovorax sp.]|nr:MerR family transcriptional regulator [Bacteriovorax sp.]